MAQPYIYSGPTRLVDGFRVKPQSFEGSARAYLVEALGTFLLTFVCGASLCMETLYGRLGLPGVALAQGGTLGALVLMMSHVSGAQFNPAVTVALISVGRQKAWHGAFYVLAQFLGAMLAGLCLRGLFERYGFMTVAPWLGTPTAAAELAPLEAMGLEALLTFVWMAALFATQIDPRGSKRAAAAAIGLSFAAAVLLAAPLTGAALNPARAFGPALAAWHWTGLHVYFTGPLLGAVAAAGFYEYVLLKPMGTSAL